MSQPLVLAIEPDVRQAGIVKRIVRENGLAEVIVVDSRDAAIAALRTSMPDVLLLSALLSPRDEDELVAHLKTLDNAGHLQTHTIPQLASMLGAGEERASGGLFSAFRRKKEAAPVAGCDPDLYADEIRTYLQNAADKKRELQNMTFAEAASRPNPAKATPAQTTAAEVEDTAAPESSWSSPFEWKPASTAKRSSRAREGKATPPPAPAVAPEPVVSPPFVAPEPMVSAPVVEPPSVIKPAAEAPVVTEPPRVVEPASAPVIAATVVGEPTIEIIEPVVKERPAPARRRAAAAETPVELDPPAAARTAKPVETPRPKAVADRPAKLTGSLLHDLIVKTSVTASGGRDRLDPVARWARSEAPRAVKGAAVTGDDVRSLIASLAVPSAVASVSYPQGVRIRRVRVPLGSDQEAAQASA